MSLKDDMTYLPQSCLSLSLTLWTARVLVVAISGAPLTRISDRAGCYVQESVKGGASLDPSSTVSFNLSDIKVTGGFGAHSSVSAAQNLFSRELISKVPPWLCALGPTASSRVEIVTGKEGKRGFLQGCPMIKKEQKRSLVRIPAGRGFREVRGMEFMTGSLRMGSGSAGRF